MNRPTPVKTEAIFNVITRILTPINTSSKKFARNPNNCFESKIWLPNVIYVLTFSLVK